MTKESACRPAPCVADPCGHARHSQLRTCRTGFGIGPSVAGLTSPDVRIDLNGITQVERVVVACCLRPVGRGHPDAASDRNVIEPADGPSDRPSDREADAPPNPCVRLPRPRQPRRHLPRASSSGTAPGPANEIALTFDMGGRVGDALAIVDWLVDHDVHATIFMTGAMADNPNTDAGRQVLGDRRRPSRISSRSATTRTRTGTSGP